MQAIEGMPGQLQRKEKTAPFGVNLMRSQVLYRAAYGQLQTLLTAYLDHTLAVLLSTALVMSATIHTALQDFMYFSATAPRAALASRTPGRSTTTAPLEST